MPGVGTRRRAILGNSQVDQRVALRPGTIPATGPGRRRIGDGLGQAVLHRAWRMHDAVHGDWAADLFRRIL